MERKPERAGTTILKSHRNGRRSRPFAATSGSDKRQSPLPRALGIQMEDVADLRKGMIRKMRVTATTEVQGSTFRVKDRDSIEDPKSL
jgi:hypothetical protein